jgi:hypothetical protein
MRRTFVELKNPSLKCLLLLSALLISLVGCEQPKDEQVEASVEPTPTPVATPTPGPVAQFTFSDVESTFEQGGPDKIWIGHCKPVTDSIASFRRTYIRFWTFNGFRRFDFFDMRFTDANCQLGSYAIMYDTSLSLGDALVSDGGQVVLPMDTTMLYVSIQPYSQASLDHFNTTVKCGITDWEPGEARMVGQSCGFPEYGEPAFDILHYDQSSGRLKFGDKTSQPGTTSLNRPTLVDEINYYEL